MWNFTRTRQTAGNICLVLFTAFLFTILVSPFAMVGNAEAAGMTFVEKNSDDQWATAAEKDVFTSASGYQLLVNLAVPLSDPNFNSLKIDFDFDGDKVISVYAKDIVNGSVYDTTYGQVYSLVYTLPAGFEHPVYTTVYGKLYVEGTSLLDVILTMNLKPPTIVETSEGVQLQPVSEGAAEMPAGNSTVTLAEGQKLDLSTAVAAAAEGGSITVAGQSKNLASFTSGQLNNVNLTSVSIGTKTIVVEKAVQLKADAPVVLKNSSLTGTLAATEIKIPEDTTILAPAGWDGKVQPPVQITSPDTTGAPADYTIGDTVIEVGSSNVPLIFDKPIIIVLPGVKGKVAYKEPNSDSWTTITQDAGDYDNPTVPAFPGEAYVTNGTDTKIITWHATQFAALEATISGDGNSPGGNSSGGGGAIVPNSLYSFNDITSHWAKDDIQFMVDKGIVKGMTADSFVPNANITRAQFATLLVNTLGLTEVRPEKATFKDVNNSAWYYGMVETAATNSLVSGYKDGSFKPEGKITRQEMAAMIANALTAKGKSVASGEAAQLLSKFNDKQQIDGWAQNSVALAVKEGIISGRTASTFVPKANATRAEGTVMLKKVLENLGL